MMRRLVFEDGFKMTREANVQRHEVWVHVGRRSFDVYALVMVDNNQQVHVGRYLRTERKT